MHEIYRRVAPPLSDGSLAGVLVAVLIVAVALCWVLRHEDRSGGSSRSIHARRAGRARAARADAKRWAAAQPDNGRGFAAGTPEPQDRGISNSRRVPEFDCGGLPSRSGLDQGCRVGRPSGASF
jgi:hypothetical protein